jgi:transcriptional regulator with XRE-family HTH domain
MLAVGLLVQGMTRKEVAEALGVDPKTIGRWLQERAVKRELAQQLESVSAESWALMLAELGEVWDAFRTLLRSEDERIRLRAVTWFLDRTLSFVPIERLLGDEPPGLTALPRSLSFLLDEEPDEGAGDAA